jgi:hypothetical protein
MPSTMPRIVRTELGFHFSRSTSGGGSWYLSRSTAKISPSLTLSMPRSFSKSASASSSSTG